LKIRLILLFNKNKNYLNNIVKKYYEGKVAYNPISLHTKVNKNQKTTKPIHQPAFVPA
jgi:hypothetical protein